VVERHRALVPQFKRTRRLTAAAEARALGYGGITAVGPFYGMSQATIHRGLRDLQAVEQGAVPGAIRRGAPAAGRRGPDTGGRFDAPGRPGDPRGSRVALAVDGHECGEADGSLAGGRTCRGGQTVGQLLKAQGYSLQANQKSCVPRVGGYTLHPDQKSDDDGSGAQWRRGPARHLFHARAILLRPGLRVLTHGPGVRYGDLYRKGGSD
jgi:hypothetical protein